MSKTIIDELANIGEHVHVLFQISEALDVIGMNKLASDLEKIAKSINDSKYMIRHAIREENETDVQPKKRMR